MRYLITLIPFLIALAVVVRFEMRSRRRERRLSVQHQRYLKPLASTTNRLFEKAYGHPSKEIESTFPEIRATK